MSLERLAGITSRILHAMVFLIAWFAVIFYTRWLWRDAGEFLEEIL